MINRRKFIKTMSMLGLSMPAMAKSISRNSGNSSLAKHNPIIVCSRGEKWGKKVLKPGWSILKKNGSLLDAVEQSANITELDPEDGSVGFGGLPNENGVVQLDASIMYGPTHNCGLLQPLRVSKRHHLLRAWSWNEPIISILWARVPRILPKPMVLKLKIF